MAPFHKVKKEMLIDLELLLRSIDLDCGRIYVYWDSGSLLSFEQSISPAEFLKFAEDDLQRGDKQGLVNALTNARRAIDSQIDKVFGCFGLKKPRNFPQKIIILNDMGLIAPRIINKLSALRNKLEHEYKLPETEQIEDVVDIANLFVFALDSILYTFPGQFFISTYVKGVKKKNGDFIYDKQILIEFDENRHEYFLEGYILDTENLVQDHNMEFQKTKKEIGQVILGSKDSGYLPLTGIASKAFRISDLADDVARLIEPFTK